MCIKLNIFSFIIRFITNCENYYLKNVIVQSTNKFFFVLFHVTDDYLAR